MNIYSTERGRETNQQKVWQFTLVMLANNESYVVGDMARC